MEEKILEQILKNTNCEYQTIRSGQLKCLADSKDIHTCICIIQDELLHICKTKCPIYRLKEKLSTAETAYQICLINKECRHRKEIDEYKQALEEISEIAKTGLKPVCYKANCSTCRCYTKDDKNYSLHCLINSYINEDGELMDGNCDFVEALEALIDSERVSCNKAKPIADKILNKINEVLK